MLMQKEKILKHLTNVLMQKDIKPMQMVNIHTQKTLKIRLLEIILTAEECIVLLLV